MAHFSTLFLEGYNWLLKIACASLLPGATSRYLMWTVQLVVCPETELSFYYADLANRNTSICVSGAMQSESPLNYTYWDFYVFVFFLLSFWFVLSEILQNHKAVLALDPDHLMVLNLFLSWKNNN